MASVFYKIGDLAVVLNPDGSVASLDYAVLCVIDNGSFAGNVNVSVTSGEFALSQARIAVIVRDRAITALNSLRGTAFTLADFKAVTYIPGLNDLSSNAISQCKVTNDTPDYFTAAGLTLTLVATPTVPFSVDIGGDTYTTTDNLTVAATDNAHNFVWIDDTLTMGVSTLPCHYRYTAPSAPATDQHWFDLSTNLMKRYDGAAWVAVRRIFIGYCRADGGTIDSNTVTEPLQMTPIQRVERYGEANSGFLDISAGTTTLDGNFRYAAVVMRGTANVAHTGQQADILTINSQGPFVMLGTSTINLNGLGNSGPAGGTGAGGNGANAGLGAAGGGGGGGTNAGGSGGLRGKWSTQSQTVGGTAGAAGGGAGGNGTASIMPPVNPIRSNHPWWLFGAGGGAGGGSGVATGGNGGNGGGGISINAPTILYAAGTTLSANGANGQNGPGANRGGGGGGGGGLLCLTYRNIFNLGTATVNGGTGGSSGGAGSGAGGNGGVGTIVTTRI